MTPFLQHPVLKLLALSGATLLLALGATRAAAAEEIPVAPAFTTEQLMALPTDNWITNGGNLQNQRYAPLDQINRDNVANLKGVWRADLMESALEFKHNNQAQPLVYDGVVYVSTGQDDVFAISVETGEVLWSYFSGLQDTDVFVCCGWVSRGV